MLTLLSLLSTSLMLTPNAAAFRGDIQFSSSEVAQHRQRIETVVNASARCLNESLVKHNYFIKHFGVSSYYGDNSSFAKIKERGQNGEMVNVRDTTDNEKRDILRRIMRVPEKTVQELVPNRSCHGERDCPLKMEPFSCIGLAQKCLEEGFAAAGEQSLWNRIEDFTAANDTTGDSLQHALQRLGWRLAYWNPDERESASWDAAERMNYPTDPKYIWGKHAENLDSVMRYHNYIGLHIDDTRSAVNFGTGVPEVARRAPFFVGIAHMGYHVFPGSHGKVVEAHSTRSVNDPREVQLSDFSPLTPGGGPQGGPRSRLANGFESDTYRSGVLALPPGY